MASYLSSYILLLVIFNTVFTSKLSTGSRNHAYFSTNEDSQYIGDNIPVTFHKEFSGATGKISFDESLFNSKVQLKFLPPVLDFKERYLGIPYHERVTIINLSCNRTVLMSSISGNSLHFYSSFFQDKIIPPLGNTSFSVVFLAKTEGVLKSYLYIQTSEGIFKYQVKGESVTNPYRVRSFSGIKVPLNSSYNSELVMHNPHPTVLQILEVYSSGKDFHLQLPSGDVIGPRHIWQIPAFFTKPIVRIKFHASAHKNFTGYLRIKLDINQQVIMIPMNVEAGSLCGLYCDDDLINFGYGGTLDPPKKIKLFLKNSSRRSIRVFSVTTSPLSKAIKIDFKPSIVPPKVNSQTEVAVLTLDWLTAYKTGVSSGNIVVKSNMYNQKLYLRYYASVFEGGLQYDASKFRFRSDKLEIPPRLINLENNFKIPIVITGISLRQSAAPYFQITNFTFTSILPGESKPIFAIEAGENFLNSNVRIESGIHISTNVSALVVPLLCFNGKLKQISTFETNGSVLNIGSVTAGEKKRIYFSLINENPIEVHIESLHINISNADIGIVSVERGNVARAMNAIEAEYNYDFFQELIFPARSYCIVQLTIPAQDIGYTYGHISVTTNFEVLYLGVKLKVNGANDLEMLNHSDVSSNCIQDHICESNLDVDSQYATVSSPESNEKSNSEQYLGLLSSHPLPPSKMFLYYYNWNISEYSCLNLHSNSTNPHKFLNLYDLPILYSEVNTNLLITQYENYLKFSAELMKLSYWMNISNFGNTSFEGHMKYNWPSITMTEPNVEDSSSETANTSLHDIVITNPPPSRKPLSRLVLEPSFPATVVFPTSSNLSQNEDLKHVSKRGYGHPKFGNRKSGSYTVLLFEVTEKHLRACERNYDKKYSRPFFSVRRSFFAKNMGSDPITVLGFLINGQSCEGFGFQVMNCEPFTLSANTSKKIDIAFSPDFTLSKISRLLTIITLNSSENFTLIATLPPYLLAVCSNYIKRPTWEPLVYYSAISFMLFLLVCILGAAYFESNRILRSTIISLSRDRNLQPVLDLRMIGSEPLNPPEQNSVHSESQCKIVWTSNAYSEEKGTKDTQKPITESIFTINCSNKCQILNNGINCKKKSERTICKRFADGTENYIEKTCWETSYSRTNSSQPMKTSICITTEPYIPLTNMKTRNSSLQKSEFPNQKYEQPRFIEFQRRKTKKKSHSINNCDVPKKKASVIVPVQNIFDESESSQGTSESCSSDDGEKDVESMFFQSVRHHLQSKVTRGRHIKLSTTSPLIKRKKSVEKRTVNVADNEWDVEDETTEKATVVRNNRRSTTSVKQIKKQTVNYGKMRCEQSQGRGKQGLGERSIKCCLRKEKTQTAKKRNDRMEKRVSSAKATTLIVSHDGVPAVPSPPVWTASFSDVVAGTESTYSSVVATKSHSSSTQNQKQQLSICTQDSGSSCSGSSTTNFSSGWKTEYQDALEHQEVANEQAPSESKNPLNSIWSNWSSLTESIHAQTGVIQASANSLFTDGSTQNNTYDGSWGDQNVIMQESQEMDNFHGVRNEINWPVLTSLWEPLYTPSTAVEAPPPVWGSDVWGPPVPPAPAQPPMEDMVQNNLEYDPFRSLSNIWAQHSPNIWKPPSTE